jgi:hypothetical protein
MKQETVQTAVRIPRAMLDRLRESELGVSEEIRQRIERTLQEDTVDPITRELLIGIGNLAAAVQADLGTAWHSYQEVQEVFAAAVVQRLAAYKPSQRTTAFIQLARDLLGETAASQVSGAPDAVGATIERADRRTRAYEQLQRLQTARARSPLSSMRRKPKEE